MVISISEANICLKVSAKKTEPKVSFPPSVNTFQYSQDNVCRKKENNKAANTTQKPVFINIGGHPRGR